MVNKLTSTRRHECCTKIPNNSRHINSQQTAKSASNIRVFAIGGMGGEYPPPAKNLLISCSHSSCTVFVLISYSFETQIMLIFILIDVQYSQNAVFSFENFLNRQNHSSSGTHHLVKKFPQQCSLLIDRKSGKLLKF